MKHFIRMTLLLLLTIAILIPSAYAQSDSDGDGYDDDVDNCPYEADSSSSDGCPPGGLSKANDTDNDGMSDYDDACPFENGDGDRNEFGCIDDDHDGVEDWFDKCPNSIDIANRPVELDGCWDQDGDGLTGDDDLCSNSRLPVNALGCWDEDQDGFAYDPNYVNQISPRDNCPTEYSTTNNGCPDPDTSTTDTSTTDTSTTDTSTTDTSNTDTSTGTHVGLPENTTLPATFEACSNSGYQPPRLEIGKLGTLVTDNNSTPLNFRPSASTDTTAISVIRAGEVFLVQDGPICSQNPNYRWWNVYFDNRSGWIVESTSGDYLARPFTINNEEVPDDSIFVRDLEQVTENGRTVYRYRYETTLEPGTIVRAFMSVSNSHTKIYVDIVNKAAGLTDVLEDSTNDDDSTNDLKNKEFTVGEFAEYRISGKSDVNGKIIIVIIPPANSTWRGNEQSSSSSSTGRDSGQSSNSSAQGRDSNSSAQGRDSGPSAQGRDSGQAADSNSAPEACTGSDLPLYGTGDIFPGERLYWDISIASCTTLMAISVEMNATSGTLDPYIEVYLDDVYYMGNDNFNGSINAALLVLIPEGTRTIRIYVSSLYVEESGDYELIVEEFLGYRQSTASSAQGRDSSPSAQGRDSGQAAASNSVAQACTGSDLPLNGEAGGTGDILPGEQLYWDISIASCTTPMVIFVWMKATSGTLDPYVDIEIDGVYYSSVQDFNGSINAALLVPIPEGARTIRIYVSSWGSEESGDYELFVSEFLGF